jgi:hypothetical protein
MTINYSKKLAVPDGTKVITNSHFLTLAFVREELLYVYTKHKDDIGDDHFITEKEFIPLNKKELIKLNSML